MIQLENDGDLVILFFYVLITYKMDYFYKCVFHCINYVYNI